MKVPDLPTPALQWTRIGSAGFAVRFLVFCTRSLIILVSFGAEKSTHFLVCRWVTFLVIPSAWVIWIVLENIDQSKKIHKYHLPVQVCSLICCFYIFKLDFFPNIYYFIVPIRPILVSFLIIILLQSCEHHNNVHLKNSNFQKRDFVADIVHFTYIVFNNHLPKVLYRIWFWGSCCYELLSDLIECDHGRIDEICGRLS